MPYPISHLYLASRAIKSSGKRFRINPYLWGSVATDTNRASISDGIEREHTHIGYTLNTYRNILEYAKSQGEKSFAHGYISHLVADNYWACCKLPPNLRLDVDMYIYSDKDMMKEVGLAAPYLFTEGDKIVVRILKSRGIEEEEAKRAVTIFKGDAAMYTGYFPGIRGTIHRLFRGIAGGAFNEKESKEIVENHFQKIVNEIVSIFNQL